MKPSEPLQRRRETIRRVLAGLRHQVEGPLKSLDRTQDSRGSTP